MSSQFPNLELEARLAEQGIRWLLAVDEVGRGALAGPVAVGVTFLPLHDLGALRGWPPLLRDSKLLDRQQRESVRGELAPWLERVGAVASVGFSPAATVDAAGIIESLREAFSDALAAVRRSLLADSGIELSDRVDEGLVLLDGSHNWLSDLADPISSDCKIKADRDCVSVAISSVLAKCERDDRLGLLASAHPGYGFESNAGYSSPLHLAALRERGPSAEHRISFLGKILEAYNKGDGRE